MDKHLLLWTLSIFASCISLSSEATLGGGAGAGPGPEFSHQAGNSNGNIHSHLGNRCEEVSIPMCRDMPYNKTILPNRLGHATQEEAGYEVHQYYALVKVACNPFLKIFLCSLFAPVCNILHEPLPPCRSLCETVKTGCEHYLLTFGLTWPENLECSNFPSQNKTELCVNGDIPPGGYSPPNETIFQHIPPRHPYDPNEGSKVPDYFGQEHEPLVCPSEWLHPEHSIGEELEGCGPPCGIFSPHQKHVAGVVVGVVATTTLISSLFTIITAILDVNRFHYPERAIVHLAGCYVGLAICYIVGVFGRDEISCHEGFIVLGPGSATCTLLFMFTYFLTLASHIWWVILSLTWYLSAGLKWGGEAIAAYSLYFHLSAWGISAFFTMASVALGYVEGDPLAGPCSLGVQRSPELGYFMVYPLILLIVIGSIFFILGFLALFRIRGEIKRSLTMSSTTGSDKVFTGRSLLWDQPATDSGGLQASNNSVARAGAARLEILMARIGIFSILYTVPAIVFLVALFYISTPLGEGGVLLPIIKGGSHNQQRSKNNQLLFVMYLIRYISNLGFGSALIIWVWSRKTFKTWKRAICGPQVK